MDMSLQAHRTNSGSTEPLLGRDSDFIPIIERLGSLRPKSTEEAILTSEAFNFQLTHYKNRKYVWVIKRTLREFEELHSALKAIGSPILFEAKSSQSYETQYSYLMDYLQKVLSVPGLRQSRAFLDFVEVSEMSFTGKSEKRKEGYVFKRTGGHLASDTHCCNFAKYFRRFQRRWLVLRDDSIGYLIHPEQIQLHEYLSFRGGIKADLATDSGYKDAVLVESSTRKFFFRTGDMRSSLDWIQQIREAFDQSEWSRGDNRYMSSFPIRTGNMAKWYVDGEEYYRDVYNALKEAKLTVYITDWWLSPELSLVRQGEERSRVMDVLGELTSREPPVKVYVHVYKEVSFALTLNSYHTKEMLRNCNVRVVRHPHRSVVGTQFLWSHHEKMVIIDGRKAFIGGLDLCFGRWDTSSHLLTDFDKKVWPGIDYSNCRIVDFTEVEQWQRDSIDRQTQPRMPWHDIALMVRGQAASDIARHFTELWNFVQTDITARYRRDKDILQPSIPSRRSSAMKSMNDDKHIAGLARTDSIWPSQEQSKIPISKLLIKTLETKVTQAIALRDIQSHSELSIEENPQQEEQFREILVPHTATKSFRAQQASFARSEEQDLQDETKEKEELAEDSKQGAEQLSRRMLQPDNWRGGDAGHCDCQLVVSCGLWSYGVEKEDSILVAYLQLIGIANYFVYIENQFFISSTAGKPVENTIAEALVLRIIFAHEHNQPFKVIVVMPLLPAFEGSITDQAAKVLRVQLHWEYATISRGEESIYARLLKHGIENPWDYISFYGLRTHAMMDKPVTEIVYVHSKLLIVDDKFALIGSANINDRSMMGDRDSEVAVSDTQMVIEDTRKVASRLAGGPVQVAEFAYTLRLRIFTEHFGEVDSEVLRDPLSEEFTRFVKERADVKM